MRIVTRSAAVLVIAAFFVVGCATMQPDTPDKIYYRALKHWNGLLEDYHAQLVIAPPDLQKKWQGMFMEWIEKCNRAVLTVGDAVTTDSALVRYNAYQSLVQQFIGALLEQGIKVNKEVK